MDRSTLISAALDRTSESVLITDALLDEPGPHIVFANKAFSAITGYAEEDVLGKSPRILQGPGTDRNELRRLRHELGSRHHFHGQAINYRKDGTAFLMDWRISPIQNAEGRVTHYIAIQRDATKQHNEDERNQQAERMETIGRVTGEIAHDFANLLTGLHGFAELLCHELGTNHPSRRTAEDMIQTITRAELLTRQLLTFSRTQDAHPQDINLSQLIKQIEVLLRQLVGERIAVNIDVRETDQCVVRGTTTELEQIVINLVTNARDAMADGGSLYIHSQRKLLEEHETAPHGAIPGHYVELTVSDTGIGMDEETVERIFEPFFTTKGEGKGTGLGLANVRRHVQKLRGLIRVQTELRRGTRFLVYIPATGAPG